MGTSISTADNIQTDYATSQQDNSSTAGTKVSATVTGNNNSTKTNSANNLTDLGGINAFKSSVNLTLSDYGAIEGGMDVAKQSLIANAAAQQSALNASSNALKESLAFAADQSNKSLEKVSGLAAANQAAANQNIEKVLGTLDTVKTEGKAETQKLTMYLAGGALLVIVVVVFALGKK